MTIIDISLDLYCDSLIISKQATKTWEALNKLYKELLEQDIMKQINTNPYPQPNVDYNTLLSVLEESSKQKYTSAKIVKFHKHKQKRLNG